jgi:xanthine dehydrogenase accessory factor
MNDKANDKTPDIWQEITSALDRRQPVIVATVVRSSGSVPRRTGAKMLVYPDGAICGSVGGGLFEALVVKDALQALDSGRGITKTYSFNPEGSGPQAFGAVCGGKAEIFLEVVLPPDRLLIVGGGHCGRALAKVASLLDFSIVVADDRADFARRELFPFDGVDSVLHLPPDYAGLPEPDNRTYVALVSKGFVTDEAALRRVLSSPAPYIGMIGSCRKRDVVFDRLRASGVSDALLDRVHAPIGLEIGAETPEEIAVSILAEIVALRARRQAAAFTPDADIPSSPTIENRNVRTRSTPGPHPAQNVPGAPTRRPHPSEPANEIEDYPLAASPDQAAETHGSD